MLQDLQKDRACSFGTASKLCMVRSKEGKKVYAKMSEGEGGFLLAQFGQTWCCMVLEWCQRSGQAQPRKAAAKKAAAKKAAAKKGCGQKNLQDCCPPMILKVPMMLTLMLPPMMLPAVLLSPVSADPPAFDPLVPLASLNEVLSHVLFQQPHHWYQGYCGGQVEADHELWRFESW